MKKCIILFFVVSLAASSVAQDNDDSSSRYIFKTKADSIIFEIGASSKETVDLSFSSEKNDTSPIYEFLKRFSQHSRKLVRQIYFRVFIGQHEKYC